jgi:hypothetical protein
MEESDIRIKTRARKDIHLRRMRRLLQLLGGDRKLAQTGLPSKSYLPLKSYMAELKKENPRELNGKFSGAPILNCFMFSRDRSRRPGEEQIA